MLEARGLSVTLGGRTVLSGITLAIRPGEVTAVIGPNGAGKSTLLGCLSGAIPATSGSVHIDGEDAATLSPAALGLRRAVLEQTPASTAAFALPDLVALGISRAVPPAEASRLTAQAIAAVGLTPLAGRSIDRLSGGERHRAHMARTLAQHHAGRLLGHGGWLLLDEPTASLDLAHQGAVLDAARDAARAGAGVLCVLHDLTLTAAMADRVAVLHRGRLAAHGPARDILTPETLAPVYEIGLAAAEPVPGALAIIPLYTSRKGASACSSP